MNEMMNHVLSYLEERGQFAESAAEQRRLETGILLFLEENGISPDEMRAYYRRYVSSCLAKIEHTELKAYFLHYKLIQRLRQIVIERGWGEAAAPEIITEVYELLTQLNRARLGENYIPSAEIRAILEEPS